MQLNSLSTRLYKIFQTNPLVYVYLPLVIYWIFLFFLTTLPLDAVPKIFNSQDKIEHFFAYLFLAFLLAFSLHFQKRSIIVSKNYFWFSILLLIAYATIDEMHQIFVPGRFCDVYDWISDVLGGVIGILFSNMIIKMNINENKIEN
ncbi:VanZ family protein [Rosettibacter firmus]|uniref:VanZ family protein n=1 Tax=Rosettibacter firmus TaxID=3111522 RepID=UPI00336BFDE1